MSFFMGVFGATAVMLAVVAIFVAPLVLAFLLIDVATKRRKSTGSRMAEE